MSNLYPLNLRLQAAEIALALAAPDRAAEAERYHRAIIDALNATHVAGVQDALAMADAIAHTLAQLFGAAENRDGVYEYVHCRALMLADEYVRCGNAARHEAVS